MSTRQPIDSSSSARETSPLLPSLASVEKWTKRAAEKDAQEGWGAFSYKISSPIEWRGLGLGDNMGSSYLHEHLSPHAFASILTQSPQSPSAVSPPSSILPALDFQSPCANSTGFSPSSGEECLRHSAVLNTEEPTHLHLSALFVAMADSAGYFQSCRMHLADAHDRKRGSQHPEPNGVSRKLSLSRAHALRHSFPPVPFLSDFSSIYTEVRKPSLSSHMPSSQSAVFVIAPLH